MTTRKLRAGRIPGVTAETWVGEKGTIFYNESSGALRISDGHTVGGNPLTLVASDFQFQFGDFVATTDVGAHGDTAAYLSSLNTDEDIILQSNGAGGVGVVGEFAIWPPDGAINTREPIFRISDDGQVRILVTSADPAAAAVNIVGSTTGAYQPPVNTGVMLHLTGNLNDASRLYNDAQGSFAAFVARRYNGTVASPTAVLNGEELMRLSGTAHNGTSIPGSGNQRILFKALGNQTLTNQGGTIELWATPQNTTTIAKVATVDNAAGFTLASGYFKYDIATGNATVTQQTSKSTTVTCNGRTGQITTSNSSLAKGTAITFTVNNNYITAATDVVVVNIQSGATVDSYAIAVTRVQATGSFNVTITNNGTGALTDTLVINFAVIKVS